MTAVPTKRFSSVHSSIRSFASRDAPLSASSSSKNSASNSSFTYFFRSFRHPPRVRTPSVTRSIPSISAVGGTSGLRLSIRVTISFPRMRAAMLALVPPATTFFPSACIKSCISLPSSSFDFGGPVKILTIFRSITRATATVVSSPGFSSYSSSQAWLSMTASREADMLCFVHFRA